MDIELLIKGLIIGFSVAAPVGPIGILCIRRTIEHGRIVGFVSGLGAATADSLYGLIAVMGLSVVTNFLVDQQMWLQLVGGAFLCYLGVKTFLSKPANKAAKATGNQIFTAYVSTLFLTITNPATILTFIAIFSGLGIMNDANGSMGGMIVVFGVFTGSAIWWLILSFVAGLLKDRMNVVALRIINVVSGIMIIILGLWSLFEVIR